MLCTFMIDKLLKKAFEKDHEMIECQKENMRVAKKENQLRKALGGGILAGDIIFVKRALYYHFAVYLGDNSVIHYSPTSYSAADAFADVTNVPTILASQALAVVLPELPHPELIGAPSAVAIHPADINEFLDGNTEFYGLDFGEFSNTKLIAKLIAQSRSISEGVGCCIKNIVDMIQGDFGSKEIHLYSPEATIQRAKKRIGERRYNVITNNCESFAFWCKIGMNWSAQGRLPFWGLSTMMRAMVSSGVRINKYGINNRGEILMIKKMSDKELAI